MKRRSLALGLAALCTRCGPVAPTETAEAAPAPLGAFHRALRAMQQRRTTAPVNVLQVGDSHTANDAFSNRMRELFQGRFGDAGRGMIPPGIPFATYRPAQVAVSAAGWRTESSLDPAARGPWGLAGVRQSAGPRAEMTLRGDTPGRLARVSVEWLGQRGGGGVDAFWDDAHAGSFSTAGQGALWFAVPPGLPGAALTLRTRGDGPTDMLSLQVMRDRPGVTWSNLGTIGATIDVVGAWDPALMAAEAARLHPALLVVAFGTNEGFSSKTDEAGYEAAYAERLDVLRRAAPGASVVVVGPPDGVRRAGPDDPACAEAPGWRQPPHLQFVRAVQRRVAARTGAFYWDWSAAMGGECSMVDWARSDPPRAQADHVHLFTLGYRATAEVFFNALLAPA